MEYDDDRFPKRKSPRLEHFDYAQPGYYFVTICTKDKQCLFGTPGQPNLMGLIAHECLFDIPFHFPKVSVDKCVVMPNHIHVILKLNDHSTELSAIIGQYKSAVTRTIRKRTPCTAIWQTSYHDHIIRNEADYQRIWLYIDANPFRWKDDCFYIE